MIDPIRFNLLAGWTIMVAGAVSGASIGLFFHKENWMGGYTSLRRRMIRLGTVGFAFGVVAAFLIPMASRVRRLPSRPSLSTRPTRVSCSSHTREEARREAAPRRGRAKFPGDQIGTVGNGHRPHPG